MSLPHFTTKIFGAQSRDDNIVLIITRRRRIVQSEMNSATGTKRTKCRRQKVLN